ncbi:MAG TPA: N-acyl homoserine lactonase family protein [Spirochaetota bacterium]|nr:N-acyl homoserine lactonase family protein [Spirochaetota bacterium]
MIKNIIYPLLTGFFTVAFKGDLKFPKVENIPSFIFLIMTPSGEPVLVDTGFALNHIPAPDSWGKREPHQEIPVLLEKHGVKTTDIKKVVQTHLHWDHAAGLKYFPHADIYIQAAEIEGLFSLVKYEESSFCPDHWFNLRDKFILIDGDYELMPGITLLRTGGHTSGHQALKVECGDKTAILLGDSPFSYEWLWTLVPESFWDVYRGGEGKKFFWQESLLHEIEKWFMAAKIIQGTKHNDYTVEDIKRMGDVHIFSHDPSLLKTESI